ncbi:MAG: hypothetical protein F4X65_11375 [Chloroflexi bacterium]|nr:hypothetical protein [Chloroflexota bacterium]
MILKLDSLAVSSRIKENELPLLAVALFLLLATAYLWSVDIRATRGASITGDEPFYLLTTQSLLADGDFDLTNQYESRSYTSFFDHPDGLWFQSVTREDGSLLSPHNPGLSFLVIPGFALGGLLGVQVQLLLLASTTLALAFVLADRLTGHRLTSWVVTLGVGLTATAFIYSTEIYPEFPAALALMVALLLVTRRTRLGVSDGLWLAATLTVMCWLGIKYAPLALIVSTYFLLKTDRTGRIALVSAGTVSAVIFAGIHLYLFGGLTPYGNNAVYAQWNTVEILAGHIEFGERYYRVWGIFIDRQFGVGRWAPLLLAAVPGLALLAVGKGAMKLVLALALAQLLMATFVAITMMGWWFAGRTMLTVLPLFAVPITLVAARSPLWGRVGVALLGCYSLAITVGLASAAHAGEVTIAVDPFDMAFPPFQGLAGLFPLYTLWTTETWWLTFFWLTLALLATGSMVWKDISSRVARVNLREWRRPRRALNFRGNTIT